MVRFTNTHFSFFPLLIGLLAIGISQAQTPAATKKLPVTIRDFNGTHQDFEDTKCSGHKRNMVEVALGADRKPVPTGTTCGTSKITEWFRDVKGTNTRYCRDLDLALKPGTENIYEKDDESFFPIDDVPTNEKIYKDASGAVHNFHFCMETHGTFKYRGGEVFDFAGDDDVWMFINNKRVIDLGGEHNRLTASVDLDLEAANLGITTGNYYNFDFFFCERQTTASRLKITTSIDILPPPAPGFHIADQRLNVIPDGDTVVINKGTDPTTFYAIKIGVQNQTVDCNDVSTQIKTPVTAAWTLGGKSLPADSIALINPNDFADGLQELVLTKDGKTDKQWVRIVPMPPLDPPSIAPKQATFYGTLDVTITQNQGADIYYTTGSDDFGIVATTKWTKYSPSTGLQLTTSATVRAIAVKANHVNSTIASQAYERLQHTAEIPVANPGGKGFTGILNVKLTSATEGAIIYYTTGAGDFSPGAWQQYNPAVGIDIARNATLRAIATKPDYINSGIMSETYAKLLSKGISGYFQDKDGDGKIETAVLVFDENFTVSPAQIRFTDPFNPSHKVDAAQITAGAAGSRSVIATFAPFAPGTGFEAGDFALILAMANEFSEHPVRMEDSVGPVLTKVESFPSVDPAVKPELVAEFSEAVQLDLNSKTLPFEIKRNDALVNPGEVQVASVEKIAENKYKFIFETDSKYPIPKDSLRINSGSSLADIKGNTSNMQVFVPVDGKPIEAIAEVAIGIQKPVTEGPPIFAHPIANPVVFQGPTQQCLGCDHPQVMQVVPGASPQTIQAVGPTWNIKTKYPFRYQFVIFDNLGQFVNKAQGEIPAADFDRLRGASKASDSVVVAMTFIPISLQGRQMGTGAYIMKGEIQTVEGSDVVIGPQGEELVVRGAKQLVFSRFGYTRQK